MAGKWSLNLDLYGRDKTASKALKGVGKTADGVGSRMRNVGSKMGMAFAGIGTAAAAAGAVIAVDFAKQSVTAFMDAEKAQARFESSLAKNNLGAYADDVTKLAESLALKTRFDDDATKSGAAILANFGLTGDQLTKLLPLVQDYAAFTGKDLDSASKAVGKALNGNVKALKELGINYKPTGDKAKDLAAIQELLNEKVGWFATKEGATAAGQADILSNQFGELQETVGGWLVPALSKLAGWIIEKVIPAISQAADWIGTNLGPVVQKLGEWITTVALPALKNMADAFMQNVWPAIQQVAGIIAENLQPVIVPLPEFWTNTLQPAIARLVPILGTVAKVIGIVVGALAVVVSWIIGKVAPVFYKILAPAIDFIIGVFEKVADAVEWVIDHFDDMVQFVKDLPGKFKSGLSTLLKIITAPFRLSFNAIAALWNNTVGKLSFTIPDWVPGIGGSGWSVPDIPMLAKGGIVTKPTLALIGEAGPEAVVPLSRGRGYGGVTVNITADTIVGRNAARELVAMIEDGIKSGQVRTNVLATR